mgnify:CR=1 FL=1
MQIDMGVHLGCRNFNTSSSGHTLNDIIIYPPGVMVNWEMIGLFSQLGERRVLSVDAH